MATNRWRGDAASNNKVLRLVQPANTESNVRITFTVGNKTLTFSGWNASNIAADITAAAFPELSGISVAAVLTQDGADVVFTGPLDDDFDVNVTISPTIEIEVEQVGRAPVNQTSRLSFSGATGGSFTLTCNGETTSAINLKSSGTLNLTGIVSAINALTSFATADVNVVAAGSDVLITWQGSYAAVPVVVVMDATELNNGGAIVIENRKTSRPATHDIYFLGNDDDREFDLTYGANFTQLEKTFDDGTDITFNLYMNATAGTFTIVLPDIPDETAAIAYNASAATIETELDSVCAGAVTVTAITGGFLVQLKVTDAQHAYLDVSSATRSPTVTIKSNESNDEIAERLTLAFGGRVDVRSEYTSALTAISPRLYVLDFVGFPGVETTLTVADVRPRCAAGSLITGVGLEKKYDSTDTTPAELWLVDLTAGEGELSIQYNDTIINEFTSTATVVTALNAADQFSEWSAVNSLVDDKMSAGGFNSSAFMFLEWISDAARLDVTSNAASGGEDFAESLLEVISSDGGTLTHLQHGGDTNNATSAVHAYYLRATQLGKTIAGSYTLAFPEGTTAALTESSNAAAVQSAVATATGYTVAVTGSGTVNDPFLIDYTGDTEPRELPTVASKAFTGDGSGSVATARSAVSGQSSIQIVRVPPFADSGTYSLKYGGEGPITLNYDDDATEFKTALELLPTLSTTADTAVTFASDSGEYRVTFQNGLANTAVETLAVKLNSLASSTNGSSQKTVTSWPTGPGNFNEPLNWSLGRIPQTGDELVLDTAAEAIRYGFKLFGAVSLDATTDTVTATGGHDLVDGQIVQFVVGDTAPTGVAAGTNYYAINVDRAAGTYQVATTLNGAAVDITDAGSNDHYAGVMPDNVLIPASFTQSIGLARANADGFVEYRKRFLSLGIPLGGQIEVGNGGGGIGSSLLRFDLGNSYGQITVYATGQSRVVGYPALIIDAMSDLATLLIYDGDVGIACYDDEVAKIGAFNVRGGSLFIGSATIANNAISAAGLLTCRRMSVAGLVQVNE